MAARQGHPAAQYKVGFKRQKGEGAPKDDKEAVKWFRKSAEQGDADAELFLGIMHADGRGVAQSLKEARVWFDKAADKGHRTAQAYLALLYQTGEGGIPKDFVLAHMWLNLAAAGGDEDSARDRDRLEGLMKRGQILEARRRAREWWKKKGN